MPPEPADAPPAPAVPPLPAMAPPALTPPCPAVPTMPPAPAPVVPARFAVPPPPAAVVPAVEPATPPGDVPVSVLDDPHANDTAHKAVATEDVAALLTLISLLLSKQRPALHQPKCPAVIALLPASSTVPPSRAPHCSGRSVFAHRSKNVAEQPIAHLLERTHQAGRVALDVCDASRPVGTHYVLAILPQKILDLRSIQLAMKL